MGMAKFDLHLHSNNSDGSVTVKELVGAVIKSGIKIFALTDHDTVAGIEDISGYIPKDIKFIKGIELTCKTGDIKSHILGYGINPDNTELVGLINVGKKLRRQKLETRINYLKDVWGIEFTKEELDWLYSRKSVVKTHLANILVKRGLADNNVEAMKKFLDGCKTGNTRFDGEEAIRVIISAGGIPVWAHPLGGEGEEHLTENDFIPKLEKMIEYGIQGLECFYSRYSKKEESFLTECAAKYNLLITGGSDWHGANKTVDIGSLNVEGEEVDSDKITILQRL